MSQNGAVLVESTVQSGDEANAVSTTKHLHRGSGEAYIHILLDILNLGGVVHALHGNVVIGSLSCYLPGRQFKGSGRQRAQEELFLRKAADPASFPILEGLWLNVSSRLWIASFSPSRDRNWWFHRAARMKVEMIPTVPSTAALSLG